MKISRFFALLAIISMVSACQNGNNHPMMTKENIGAVTGAVGGAWIGSNVGKGKGNIAAIAAGTLLGGYLGKNIGASLDKADMLYYNRTSQQTLETGKTGQTTSWQNPDSGNRGTITPVKTYKAESGSYCREYQQTITVGGRTEEAYGTACRQADGTWEIKR